MGGSIINSIVSQINDQYSPEVQIRSGNVVPQPTKEDHEISHKINKQSSEEIENKADD